MNVKSGRFLLYLFINIISSLNFQKASRIFKILVDRNFDHLSNWTFDSLMIFIIQIILLFNICCGYSNF